MTENISPAFLQSVPNSDHVLLTINKQNKTSVVELNREDIATLRESLISYYKKLGHIPDDYQPNVVKGIKPKLKPLDENKTIRISAKLYKGFQQLYNQNLQLKEEVERSHNEIHRLNNLIKGNTNKKNAE